MFRPVRATALRSCPSSQLIRQSQRHQRRLVSFTPPAHQSRSIKSGLARWALAAGGLYWYMTRDVDIFAEDAKSRLSARQKIEPTHEETEELPTIETVSAARRERRETTARDVKRSEPPPPSPSSASPVAEKTMSPSNETSSLANQQSSNQSTSSSSTAPHESISKEQQVAAQPTSADTTAADAAASAPASPANLEEEAEAEGAFNEETGEINWDCPCLGGMAHGPCGEQFREAFSCFVFSKEEPKGIECIDRFKNMQECFRQHPDVYGAELRDVDDDGDAASADEEAEAGSLASANTVATESQVQSSSSTAAETQTSAEPQRDQQRGEN